MRTSNTQLPSARELAEILASESQRKAVRYDFLDKYPDIFSAYKQAATTIGASIEWINQYRQLDLETLGLAGLSATEQLYASIHSKKVDRDLLHDMFDSLAISDAPRDCDAIFVFGSPANTRITRAVELYEQGVASLIIMSGKGPYYGVSDLSESERMAQYAIEHGVPQEAIMIEPESITLPDNVKRTLDAFEIQQFTPRSMCMVATSYVMRRAVMEWYKFTPWDIEIIATPCEAQSPELRRDTWHQSERGIRMLLNEYAKMVLEHKMDLIRRNQ